MTITLPAAVAPNELIQSAWGNAVVEGFDQANTDILAASTGSVRNTTNQVMTGQLTVDLAAGSSALVMEGSSTTVIATMATNASVELFNITANTNGTVLESADDLVLMSEGVERWRADAGIVMTGKSGTNLALPGVETVAAGTSNGSIRSTITAASIQNVSCRHGSAADANAESFVDFSRGSVIGSITQVSTTGVAYNTTSDERVKTVLRDLDDDEVAIILRLIAPVVFEFNEDPGNEHIGFIAQHLAATWPQFVDVGIVTVGRGEPGDEVELDDEGNQVSAGFRPWMVDLSKLVPLLVAGWQQLDRRLTAVEAG